MAKPEKVAAWAPLFKNLDGINVKPPSMDVSCDLILDFESNKYRPKRDALCRGSHGKYRLVGVPDSSHSGGV